MPDEGSVRFFQAELKVLLSAPAREADYLEGLYERQFPRCNINPKMAEMGAQSPASGPGVKICRTNLPHRGEYR